MKPSFLRSIIRGVLSALICWGAMLAVFSLLLTRFEDPATLTPILANVALYLGAVISGRLASADTENRLLCAALTGLAVAFPVLLCSLVLSEWGGLSLVRLVLTALCTMLGFISRRTETASRSSAKRRKEIARRYS